MGLQSTWMKDGMKIEVDTAGLSVLLVCNLN